MSRERLRHEADLHQRLDAISRERIKNAIRDGPVVHRRAVRQFRVDIRRSPFQRPFAGAGSQQIVSAKVDRHRAQSGQFVEQFLAVARINVVGLIGPPIIPYGLVSAGCLVGVDCDQDRFGA